MYLGLPLRCSEVYLGLPLRYSEVYLDCDNAHESGDTFSVAKTYAGTLGKVGTAKN